MSRKGGVIAGSHRGRKRLLRLAHFFGKRCAIGGMRAGASYESDETGQCRFDIHAQCSRKDVEDEARNLSRFDRMFDAT
jgi:hypothetical protein